MRAIINLTTGEITVPNEHQKIRIVNDKTIEYLSSLSDRTHKLEKTKNDDGMTRFEPNTKFTKIFDKEFEAISKEMSGTAMNVLMMLIPYAALGSNILISLNNKKKLDKKYILDNISPYSYNTTVNALNELKDLVAIVEASDKDDGIQYIMNPYIYFKGGYINKTILGLFSNYKRRS